MFCHEENNSRIDGPQRCILCQECHWFVVIDVSGCVQYLGIRRSTWVSQGIQRLVAKHVGAQTHAGLIVDLKGLLNQYDEKPVDTRLKDNNI